jgi:NitT/TauT family transport system permease protein
MAAAVGILSGVFLWLIASHLVGSELILPGPVPVARRLLDLLDDPAFWKAVLGSFERVLIAFLLATFAGSITGALAGLFPLFDAFLAPVLTVIRATPVLALILVAMFWLPSTGVPVFSAFLMSFPVSHTAAQAGIRAADGELLEMAGIFKVPVLRQWLQLRLPQAASHMLSGATNALGLSWKVVVAGEVLSQPRHALGSGLQDARLSLETGTVLAWAVATVFLCGISEFMLGRIARHVSRSDPRRKAA